MTTDERCDCETQWCEDGGHHEPGGCPNTHDGTERYAYGVRLYYCGACAKRSEGR